MKRTTGLCKTNVSVFCAPTRQAKASTDSNVSNSKVSQLTDFQWEVLAATTMIPLGQTRSYQWIAQKIGRPKAVRAVGQALRRNPYPLIIPCHRVIQKNGSPGAYSGKYDGRKAKLLAVEKEILSRCPAREKF